jgi:hypothetical protein
MSVILLPAEVQPGGMNKRGVAHKQGTTVLTEPFSRIPNSEFPGVNTFSPIAWDPLGKTLRAYNVPMGQHAVIDEYIFDFDSNQWRNDRFGASTEDKSIGVAVSWIDSYSGKLNIRLYVLVQTTINQYSYDGEGWSGPASLPGVAAPGTHLAAGRWHDNTLFVFHVSDVGHVRQQQSKDGGKTWQVYYPGSGRPVPARSLSIAAVGYTFGSSNFINIYYQGKDGMLDQLYWNGNTWEEQLNPIPFISVDFDYPISAVQTNINANNRVALFYREIGLTDEKGNTGFLAAADWDLKRGFWMATVWPISLATKGTINPSLLSAAPIVERDRQDLILLYSVASDEVYIMNPGGKGSVGFGSFRIVKLNPGS